MTYNVFSGTLNPTQSINQGKATIVVGELQRKVKHVNVSFITLNDARQSLNYLTR